MALHPVAGCHIYIGDAVDTVPDEPVAADFPAVGEMTEIKKWTQMGDIGDSSEVISTNLIDADRTVKQKGTRDAGSMQNVWALDRTDAGQTVLRAAAGSKKNYPIRIVYNDAPATGASPTPSETLFFALVMDAREAGGGANTIRTLNSTFEINSAVVPVAASAGA